jgi:hypothetical protein
LPSNFHQLRDTTDPALVRRLVFIDERWTRDQHDLHSRGDRGRLLLARVPHQHGKRLTFIAGLSHEGILAPCVTEGPINSDSFAARVGQFLIPELEPGSIVVLDNPGSHMAPHRLPPRLLLSRRMLPSHPQHPPCVSLNQIDSSPRAMAPTICG